MSGISPLNAVGPVTPHERTHAARSAGKADGAKEKSGFGELLDGAVKNVDDLQSNAERSVVGLTTGEVEDVHQVMIAMNEADLAFRMMLEVRNKLVEAYKEVARLQM
jgi:flagellar hook-basal body complex protein FliE